MTVRNAAANAAVLLLVLAGVQAHAQGTLAGTVRDAAGEPLPAARVTASGRATATDAAGAFVLRGLPAGEVRVEARLLGYAPGAATALVREDGTSRVDIVLVRTPLELPGVHVVASPAAGEASGVGQATARLAGKALDREVSGTLASTLASQPGVAVRSMGPAASMPVLRGLTGDRILVLQDGQRTGDLAGSADDHGTTVDPLAARRIEVIRGPAALLYGNNALGGVVNVVSADLPDHLPAGVEWSGGAHSESAHPGAAASLRAAAPLGGGWVAGGRAGARRARDLRLPGGGRLENTAAESWTAALGAGHVGAGASGGAVVRAHGFGYGLPVAPGTDPVRLEGERLEVQARLAAREVRAEAGAQRYAHDELDAAGGALLQRFELRTGTASLLARQGPAGPAREGAWGATLLVKDYSATGPDALTPPARSRGLGVFGYQEVPLGPAELRIGGRWDGYRTRSEDAPKFGAGHARTFRALSGSAGVVVPLAPGLSASAGLSRAFRAPTVEELFSSAAHAGTGAVELGDPALHAEHATSLELGARGEGARWAAEISAYRNRIDGYVLLAARGDTVIGGAVLPVLAYTQAPASIHGVEGSLEVVPAGDLVVGLSADWLRGSLRDGTPLSYMPAPSLAASLRWDGGRWSLGGDLRRAFAQRRVGSADELPTPGATLARLSAALRLPYAGGAHTLTLRVDNLTDAEHRESTSRIKDFAPGAGRSVSLLYRVIR